MSLPSTLCMIDECLKIYVTDRQTDRQGERTDGQTDGQAGGQTDRQTERQKIQTNRQTENRSTDGQTGRQTKLVSQTHRNLWTSGVNDFQCSCKSATHGSFRRN